MKQWLTCSTLVLTLLSSPGLAVAKDDTGVARATGAAYDKSSALVELKGAPIADYAVARPAPGKKIDFSGATVKNYRAQLAAERNDFKQWLRQNAPRARVSSEFD